MNIYYLSLYIVAAIILAALLIKTYTEKEKIGSRVMVALGLELVCVLGYAMNFVTDEYSILSASTSIMFAAQDFSLVAILVYTITFTRFENKFTKYLSIASAVVAAIDSAVFIVNIFNEVAINYSMNKCDGVYVLGYEGELWFGVHAIIDMVFIAFIIGILVIKCMRIPRAYWGRYIFMAAGLVIIVVMKYVFISKTYDLRFDISIFLYAFLGALIYWNTFWYSKKTMLSITHTMIIDNMDVPVILFDYEDVLADFNTAMKGIFAELEYDKRDQTLEWFVEKYNVPMLQGENTFEWKVQCGDELKDFDCRVVLLSDDRKKVLGKIIVMQDVTNLKKAYYDLECSVIYDKLTGLFSKVSFMDHCRNYDDSVLPVSIVVCNINGLGEINSKFGQREGDEALVRVAEVLKRELAGKAYVARLDDGNFIAILENTIEDKATEIFEKIKSMIFKECSSKKYSVSIEYGVSVRDSENAWMMDVVHEATRTMKNKKMMNNFSSSKSLVGSLAQTLTESDIETEDTVKRIKALAMKLGEAMHLSDADMSKLAMLVVLHDIGKIAIPAAVLAKKEKLDDSEWELIKSHTERGYRIAKSALELEPIADDILSHHEKWDGSGYPNGLKGEKIPLLARILSVVDAYDAMTTDKPYHKAMSKNEAVEELKSCSGSQFDPAIVDVFAKMMSKK